MNKSKTELKMLVTITMPIVIIAVLAIVFNRGVQAQTLIDTTAATGIDATLNTTPAVNATDLRDKIRADVLQNTRAAEEARKQMLEKNRLETTKPKIPNQNTKKIGNQVEKRIGDQNDNRPSSTSPQFRKEGYENNGRAMVAKLLKERKEMVAKQLNVAIKNLEELRKRIGSRMEKDRLANKNLGPIVELVKVADTKIVLAKEAVAKLRSYEPVATNTTNIASTTSGTTTIPVNLDQIRGLIDNAQKSIKEAHRALNDVVVAIAKISGLNKERTASSTPMKNVTPASSPLNTTLPSPVTSIPPSTN